MTQNHTSGSGRFSPVTLVTAPVGKKMRLHALNTLPETCKRLREMGFCESAQVIKLSGGSNLICQVRGVRLALGRDLGECILLEPMDAKVGENSVISARAAL